MVYQGGNMVLDTIWEVFRGPVNDVVVCRDLRSPVEVRYTVLVLHDRACVRTMLTVLENGRRGGGDGAEPYLCRFAQNELMCFVFPYRSERRLSAFAAGQLDTPQARERVCVNLVMECLSSCLPFPLLYLALNQDNVHLTPEGGVYITPNLDLSALREEDGEGACVAGCAQLLLELLEGGGRRRLKSYEIIRKKTLRSAYAGFPELYRDVRVTAVPLRRTGLRDRLRALLLRGRDGIFKVLLVLCTLTILVTLLFLISQLIFGDVPLLRLFERAFEVIGTETLR